jgi:dipeptidyl aminopeptidase/acylaminoacyl peptidase
VFDLYRIDLATGESRLDTENPGDVVLWLTDRDFQVRGATALRPSDSATLLRVRDDERSPWREIVVWPFERAGPDRAIKLLGFVGHDTLLAQTWAEGNTSRLVTMSARDGRVLATLASDSRCDLWNVYDGASGSMQPQVILSRESGRALAAGFEYLKPEWRALDRSVAGDLAALDRLAAGAVWTPVSTDASGRRWVVLIFGDRDAGRYVMWDRHARKATPLFWSAPALRRFTLAPMKPLMVPARDGLELPCYLTLPANVPARHLPLVLLVHGGPWFRDGWGFQPEVQWLANRGYAVLQVNFRASTGFGVDFVNAGDHQFGTGSVQHDLTDAVRWAIARGIADPGRVGIMGWSFGGYATLCGLAFTPELYACGVDGVGPSRLSTLIESFPSYWGPRKRRWLLRMGDVVADSALDRRISPYFHVDAVRAPLLIGHGANDPRVKLAESEQIVKALRGRGREVRFVVYPDEGHGFGRAENNLDFYGRAEEFLARYLGGRAEPWREVKGATAQVR